MSGLPLTLTPLALGVAASPVPVVAVLIILLTNRARLGSIIVTACWLAGNLAAIVVCTAFADAIPTPHAGPDLAWEGAVTFLLGVGLVVMGVLSRRGRMLSPQPDPPTWVHSVDNLSPWGAGLVAFLNATTSPKNLALAITAGRTITRLAKTEFVTTASWAYYTLIAGLSILAPVVVYWVMGQRSAEILSRWRDSITKHAAAVMEIVLFVLGLGLSLKGLYNLFT